MSEIVEQIEVDGVDDPFTRWCAVVTYPVGHAHRFAGVTVRFRADGSRQLAEMRRNWHQANGASAVLQRQMWTPTVWEDVPEGGQSEVER